MNPAALIVIDVQYAFDDQTYWGKRNNPGCESNISCLVSTWQDRGWPIVVVRHDSDRPGSPLHPSSAKHSFKDCVPQNFDLLVTKNVNSAFYGTPSLEEWLHTRGINKLVICGITTNHCCETTARMAGNLGFDVSFILDATACFPRTDHEGKTVSADEIMRATAANLHGEFANVMTTANYVEACARNSN